MDTSGYGNNSFSNPRVFKDHSNNEEGPGEHFQVGDYSM